MPRTFVIMVVSALALLAGRTACHAQQQDSTGAGGPTGDGNEWIGIRYPPCLMELLIMVETAWIEVGTAWEILLMRITVLALLISAVGR